MTGMSIVILRKLTTLFLMCIVSTATTAECERRKPTPISPATAPDFDGPGSFGPLHDTVTLDCLTYVGSLERNGKERVLIRDETGKVHQLQLGDYMGENGGVITKIDQDTIYVTQIVERNGWGEKRFVKFPKHGIAEK